MQLLQKGSKKNRNRSLCATPFDPLVTSKNLPQRFRELGLEDIGVADAVKEAGVTVGGFYKHFNSRDELVVEALAPTFQDLERWEEHTDSLQKVIAGLDPR